MSAIAVALSWRDFVALLSVWLSYTVLFPAFHYTAGNTVLVLGISRALDGAVRICSLYYLDF